MSGAPAASGLTVGRAYRSIMCPRNRLIRPLSGGSSRQFTTGFGTVLHVVPPAGALPPPAGQHCHGNRRAAVSEREANRPERTPTVALFLFGCRLFAVGGRRRLLGRHRHLLGRDLARDE